MSIIRYKKWFEIIREFRCPECLFPTRTYCNHNLCSKCGKIYTDDECYHGTKGWIK